jgi:hypothetical protein
LQLRVDDGLPVDAGFVKNEFVVAHSEAEARSRAIRQVRDRLQKQADEGRLVLKSVDLEVDEISSSLKLWKLAQQEGFVFFPEEKRATDDRKLH